MTQQDETTEGERLSAARTRTEIVVIVQQFGWRSRTIAARLPQLPQFECVHVVREAVWLQRRFEFKLIRKCRE